MLATFVADARGITGGTAAMLRAAGLFHELVPELEQRTLVRAFELALSAEWAMEGATLPDWAAAQRAPRWPPVLERLRYARLPRTSSSRTSSPCR